MKTMQKVQQGFTLIELMIVVAIIGILAALAIPAYQDYTIKSRVGEGASLTGAFKTAIEIYWSENGTLSGLQDGTVNASTLGMTAVNAEYVSEILIEVVGTRPIVQVTLNSGTNKLGDTPANGGADGACFEYSPAPTGGAGSNLQWSVQTTNCGANAIPAKYLPRT